MRENFSAGMATPAIKPINLIVPEADWIVSGAMCTDICRSCIVAMSGTSGESYIIGVSASTPYDAVRQAVEFFNDSAWVGPKPMADTILKILPMGGEMVRVKVGDATAFNAGESVPAITRCLAPPTGWE